MSSPIRTLSSRFATGYYDKWIFFIFIASTLMVSFYFSTLSKGWEKPAFENIVVQEDSLPYFLNYQKDKGNLVITSQNIQPIEVSCLTVEVDLCGRGNIPYAYNYELESANIVHVEGVKYFDRLTYVVNKTSVSELQTTLRSYAQDRITGYNNKQTLYMGLIGILFGLYCMYRFFSFSFKKDN